ncbi:hypothetical protein So717_11750 [Roseobacter cerasinus]|uniref:DSBA-like thioredoxin domain-containing protein n=1 Tax=Roseobacter cerasinus TaxID=2602289 RepID=A0A640VP24_9RHOB|nr:DsbA family protein [Roseobacter cerasinus]GFE49422.1 hypothetical protein So717_11750 [Roseobacter cerasinus]
MRRRDALIVGGAIAVAVAIPQLLQRRVPNFEFTEMANLPGFRRLQRGALSGGPDIFAGLETEAEAAASARLPRDLCRAIFPAPAPSGHVPVAVFSDYYCPYCAILDQRLAALQRSGAEISLIFHELPLLGPRSVWAAQVALAAAQQADHTAVHLEMMQHVLRPGRAGLRDLAERHDLDLERLAKGANSAQVVAQVEDAMALGRALGLLGTPSLAVGRTLVVGALSEAELNQLIGLERQRQPPSCL